MAKYAVKFAKGRPVVVDVHGNPVPGAVVRRLNFPGGPVDVAEARKWGPDHRPHTVDIEVNGVTVGAVPCSQRGSNVTKLWSPTLGAFLDLALRRDRWEAKQVCRLV